MSELDGFVLFKNEREPMLCLSKNALRVNAESLSLIGSPEYLNFFFDESRKRMAIKSAVKGNENVFALTKNGVSGCSSLIERIKQITGITEIKPGENLRFRGRKFGEDYVIFDLTGHKSVQYNADPARFKKKDEK